MPDTPTHAEPKKHFIHQIIDEHIAQGRWGEPGDSSVVRTRFPPEPNGYLHIGHAKAITLSHSLARQYNGSFVLRFDDTNPVKEEQEYVDSIVRDVRWLGVRWEGMSDADPAAGVRFASDYFPFMHDCAVELIQKDLAYVDEQSPDQIRATRGTLTTPGAPSPYRDRPPEESLAEFEKMVRGEYPDGSRVLRAKIDMASPNLNLRDPVMYRVLNAPHHRTGSAWHVYPMYDWAHGLEDSLERITHSICTLEFENHRPLYDWFINAVNKGRNPDKPGDLEGGGVIHHAQQIEFARLNPTYIITSKRKLRELVESGHLAGWDDPRSPTVAGLRRRGYTARAITSFCESIGTTRFNAKHDITLLENAVRDDLNKRAPRRMCVLRPLKVTITNWQPPSPPHSAEHPDVEILQAVNNPEDQSAGTRDVPFSKHLYIEQEDFLLDAPKKFFRLAPGQEVRLRYAYWITCNDVVTDDAGNVTELLCTYDPQTRGGDSPPPDADGNVRKVKGTLHWVSADHAVRATVRLYDRLFAVESPDKKPKDAVAVEDGGDWDWKANLNPHSLETIEHAYLEPNWTTPLPHLTQDGPAYWEDHIDRFQFERLGYFALDPDSTPDNPVFNRTVTLKDSWTKQAAK